ncbi:lipopolysaccharide biosynthesis protein [Clostridium thermobutyricum]|uniref:lipopolysaccharide biosynthesis protein n=1 Tax=Clostridium thermobutyricum TaxID=29372 RepID=UPI003F51DC32
MCKKFENKTIEDSSAMILGTVLAQIIPILFQPILKRVYTPEQFGAFDLYYKILSILVVIYAFRYDIAPILPKSNKKSIDIILLTIVLCFINSILSFIIIHFFSDKVINIFNIDHNYYKYIYFLPLGVSIFVINSALGNYITKLKNFKGFSKSRVIRRCSEGVSQLIFLGSGIGLYIGDFIGNLFSTIYLIKKTKVKENFNENTFSKEDMKNIALEYKKIPKYDLLPNLLNVFSMSLLTFVVVNKFGITENGYLELANKLLVLPASIISVSIGQIYLQRTTEILEGNLECIKEIKLITIVASICSFIFFLGVIIFSDRLIEMFFGQAWLKSAELCKILIISSCLTLVISPMGRILIGLGEFRINSIWQISKFIIVYAISTLEHRNIYEYLYLYNFVISILYIIYFIIIIYKIKVFIKVKRI